MIASTYRETDVAPLQQPGSPMLGICIRAHHAEGKVGGRNMQLPALRHRAIAGA